MARPSRNTVDYFPFICEDGKKMFYIEQTYGNDGFAVFVKLLRELAKTEYHYLNLSDNNTLLFLAAKCRVSKEVMISIINDLVTIGKFDATLWVENNVVWCQDFIDSIQDAYIKRKNTCMTYEGLLTLLIGLRTPKPIKSKTGSPVKPQSIEEDRKEKESKVNVYREFDHLLLSQTDFDRLNVDYDKKTIDKVLDNIYNFKLNKKYKSLYLTAKNWLEKEPKKNTTQHKRLVDL